MDIALMLKPASSGCNMKCGYCFYRSLSSERDTPFFGIMSEKTANATIDGAYAFASGGKVNFVFQGGEPTLAGLPFFISFVERTKSYDADSSRTTFALQTNGLLLNEEWGAFLHENSFLVGLSLDGDTQSDCLRVDNGGRYVTERVLAAARLLKSCRVEFNILCVVTKKNADAGRLFSFFESKGLRYLQFIRCLKPFKEESKSEEFYLTDDEYADFLCHAFDEYRKRWISRPVSVRYFDGLVALIRGERNRDCDMQRHCSIQFVVEGNGNVYPCDFYCLDKYLMGNVNTDAFRTLAASRAALEFVKSTLTVREECKRCDVFKLCMGGCRRYRECYDVCKVNKKVLHYILEMGK